MLKRPLLAVPGIPKDDGIKFIMSDREIFLGSEIAPIAWSILELCNGMNPIHTITEQLSSIDANFTIGFLNDLNSLGIVIDSCEVYKRFHAISANPMTYPSDITDKEVMSHVKSPRMKIKEGVEFSFTAEDNLSKLTELQRLRSSCRNFTGEPLSIEEVGVLLNVGYSFGRHAVPSAGNLYPMKIFVIALEDQKDFPAGYYEYDSECDRLILFNGTPDFQRISHAFNAVGLPFGASVMLVIAADANRQPYKYSNLGYRFMAIEAGEIAQNIALGAIESGMDTCLLGGMREKEVSDELQLEGCLLFLAIALGKSAGAEVRTERSLLSRLEDEVVGDVKPVRQVWLTDNTLSNDYGKSYFQFLSVAQNGQIASGISTSWSDARLKAIAEGYERQRSTDVFYNVYSSAQNLPGPWLDPRVAAPLTDAQYIRLPHLQKFNEDLEIEWIRGVNHKGEAVFVPIDLVFYSMENLGRKLVVDTCSSGFAAYTNFEEAVNRGLLELIERDGLMRSWYEKRSPHKLDPAVLPTHLRNRMEYWKDRRHNIVVLDLSQKGVIIIEVVIISDSYPCFVSGASSSLDTFEEATIKAFQEAESRLIYGLNAQKPRRVIPRHVHSVLDHEMLYAQSKQYHEYVRFLFGGKTLDRVPVPTASIDTLKKELEIVVVDVSEKHLILKVAKVLSCKLIPISFGFGAGHYSHHSLTGVARGDSLMPHYFA